MNPTSSIQAHVGDLLAVPRGLLVHGCNAQGVMGAGVAKFVRLRYPLAYRLYRERFDTEGLTLGEIIPVVVEGTPEAPVKVIVNAITQDAYGTDRIQVDYAALAQCFRHVGELARRSQLEVHFPLIGCGLAGGSWDRVAPLIEQGLAGVPAHLWTLPT